MEIFDLGGCPVWTGDFPGYGGSLHSGYDAGVRRQGVVDRCQRGGADPARPDIPAAASAAVVASGLGPFRPAESLYQAMADHAHQVGPTERREAWGVKDRSGWFGSALWARLEPLVGSGGRIAVAQEVLGPDEVLATTRALLDPSVR